MILKEQFKYIKQLLEVKRQCFFLVHLTTYTLQLKNMKRVDLGECGLQNSLGLDH